MSLAQEWSAVILLRRGWLRLSPSPAGPSQRGPETAVPPRSQWGALGGERPSPRDPQRPSG